MLKKLCNKENLCNKELVYFFSYFIFMLVIFSSIQIYGDFSNDYQIENIQIECLFDSEQEILKTYNMEIETEDIPIDLKLDLENNQIINPENIDNIEETVIESIHDIKVREFKDEYSVYNRMASKNFKGYVGKDGFVWPLENNFYISSYFAYREHPVFGGPDNHLGVDIPAVEATPIHAAKAGVIITSQSNETGYGNYLIIQHEDGKCTLYGHMVAPGLDSGIEVSQGDVIGYVGSTGTSTGNHLHFEIWESYESRKRYNPLDFFAGF